MDQKEFELNDAKKIKTNEEFGFSIYWLKKGEQENGILFTKGLSDRNQSESTGVESEVHPFIELYFYMPTYWDLSDTLKSWPIDWLERIASVPQKNNTWFGPGDTLPTGKGHASSVINSEFQQSFFILNEPVAAVDVLKNIGNSEVKFLSIIPIFKSEFEFKNSHSAYRLFQKMSKENFSEELDQYRPVIAKKKFFGLF